ncbi:hypothetical protein K431DRAFT_288214 [Polychaeton citri CBS 116435]|uniref:Uncharacterized protein n=1 Tax=Polychaeton citri CBS 116435 TaxID=1314669 RepID=A0A9P4UMA7_9PEZI|nr:hypothetical protein K431DRAFT_288214 [Polychaeton citri CBS 116435]
MSTVREMPMDSPTVPLSQAPRHTPNPPSLTPNKRSSRLDVPDVSPISPEDDAQEGERKYEMAHEYQGSDDDAPALHEKLRLSQLQLGPLEFETRRGPRDTLVRGLGLSFGDSTIEENMFPLPPSDRNSILLPAQTQKRKPRRKPNLTIDMQKIEEHNRPPAPPPKSPRHDAEPPQPVSAASLSRQDRCSPVSPEAPPPPVVRESPLNRPLPRLEDGYRGSAGRQSQDHDPNSAHAREDSRPSTSGSVMPQQRGRPRKESSLSNESRATSKSSARSSSRYSGQDNATTYLRADKPLPVLSPIAASIRSDFESRSAHDPAHSRHGSENAATLTPPRSKFGLPRPESPLRKEQPNTRLEATRRIPRKPVTPPDDVLHKFPQPNTGSISQANLPPRLDSKRGAPRVFGVGRGAGPQPPIAGQQMDDRRRIAGRNESQNLGQDTIEVARSRMAAARLRREEVTQQQHGRPMTPPTNALAPPRLPVAGDDSRPATPSKDHASPYRQRVAEKLQSKSTTSLDRSSEDSGQLPLRQRAPSDITKPLPIKRMYTSSYNAFNPYSPGLDNEQASRNISRNNSRKPNARTLNPDAWETANSTATTSKESLAATTDSARPERHEDEPRGGARLDSETTAMGRTPLLAQIKSNSRARISSESKRSDRSSKKAPESPQRKPVALANATAAKRTSIATDLKQPMSKFNKQLPEGPSLQALEQDRNAAAMDTPAPALPPKTKRPGTPEKPPQPALEAEDPLKTLEGLSTQSEALHARYTDLRAERQKLTVSITETIREMKAGPGYANRLLDQQLSLNAIQSSMDICFAKLKSLDCRKEEAIQKLIAKTKEDMKQNSPKAQGEVKTKAKSEARSNAQSEAVSNIPVPPIPDDEPRQGDLTHSLSIKSVKEIGAGRPVEVSRAQPAMVVTIKSHRSSDLTHRRLGSNYKGSSGGSSMLILDVDDNAGSPKASSEIMSVGSTPEDGFRKKIRVKGAQAATILGLVAESANISPGLIRAGFAMGDNSAVQLESPEVELHIQRPSQASGTNGRRISTVHPSRGQLQPPAESVAKLPEASRRSKRDPREGDGDSASTERPPSRSAPSPPPKQDAVENTGSTSASTVSTDDTSLLEHETSARWHSTTKATEKTEALPVQTIQVLVDDDILDYYGDA